MKATNEVMSTDKPAAITFDTLSAAKELKETGVEDRQAEAIVATISKAMSETVATKADLELQSAATRADIEALRTATKSDIEALRTATKSDIEALRAATKSDVGLLRSDMECFKTEIKADMTASRSDTKADIQVLRADLKLLAQSVDNRFEKMDFRFKALEQSIVIKLGALMVTMTFLLLAIGPFYIRWVMSLMGAE